MSDVNVELSGPVFDGRAEAIIHRMKDAVEVHIAEAARDRARERQLAVFRVQTTGAEPASLHVEEADFHHIVTDHHDIVYGPWLEGTGSRNETTRFKGYHTMRIVASEIQTEASALAEEAMAPYIEEMN